MKSHCPIGPSIAGDGCMIARSRQRSARLRSASVPTKAFKADSGENKTPPTNNRRDTMIERLERALVLVAYIVLRHGPVYAPYIDRLEGELKAARQNDPTERAKRILETYAVEGSPNATRLERLRLRQKDDASPVAGDEKDRC